MAKKWEMPLRSVLVRWAKDLKEPRIWRKLTQWEKDFIDLFYRNVVRNVDFIPSRATVEKLEEIYAERS